MNDQQEAAANAWSTQHIRRCCCGGRGYIYANVPMGHILWGAAIPCICRRDAEAKERADRLRRMSGIDEHQLRERTFATFEPGGCAPAETRATMKQVKALCERWAERPDGWLILVGKVGSGKTHLAQAIARAFIDSERSVYMASMPDLLAMLRDGYDSKAVMDYEDRVGMLCDVDLLVIDDLGAERGTDWSREQLYRVVNTRYEKRKHLVVTSNVRLNKAVDVDERIISRLSEGAGMKGGWSRMIELPCGDYRVRRAA